MCQLCGAVELVLTELRQQAASLTELHRELHDDNRLIESRLSELPMTVDTVTSSLVRLITDAANSRCILGAAVIDTDM